MASIKVEVCLKKKKPTPSTNIPLLSYRKSEQQDCSYQASALNVPTTPSGLSSSSNMKKIKYNKKK